MALTKINNNTLSAITGLPAGVGGKVLQVVQAVNNSASATSVSSWTDFPSLSASITPSSSSNKILIQYHAYLTLNNLAGMTRIIRGSTAIGIGASAGNRILTTSHHMNKATDANHGYHGFYGQFLDSPSTTSATTYKLQLRSQGNSTCYINRSSADADEGTYSSRSISTFTIFEVSA